MLRLLVPFYLLLTDCLLLRAVCNHAPTYSRASRILSIYGAVGYDGLGRKSISAGSCQRPVWTCRRWRPGARFSGSPRFTSWRGARGSTHLISIHAAGWPSMVARSDSGELTSSSWIFTRPLVDTFFATRLTPTITEMMRGTIGPAGMMRTVPGTQIGQ